MIHIGPLSIHVESLVLGIVLGVAIPAAVDLYVLRPVARWLEWVEHRWNDRFRAG